MTRDLESMKAGAWAPRLPGGQCRGPARAGGFSERTMASLICARGAAKPSDSASRSPSFRPGLDWQRRPMGEAGAIDAAPGGREGRGARPKPIQGHASVAPPRRPFFGDVPPQMRPQWEAFFADVAVLAFPLRERSDKSQISTRKHWFTGLRSRLKRMSNRGSTPRGVPVGPANSTIPLDKVST